MKFTATQLFPKQKEIAQDILSSDAMYHVVCTSRQFGKSFMLKQLLLAFAMNNPNSDVMFVSMTLQQSNKVFKELLRSIGKSNIIAKSDKKENSITLINASTIYVRSYQFADALRGYSIDYLIVDECAFCRDEDFEACIRPVLAVKGRKCVLCSTPRGYNFFQKMAVQGQDTNDRHVAYYTATYRDNPFANMQEIEDARRKLPNKIFLAEYEAQFIAGGMSAFENYRQCVGLKLADGQAVAGIDVGRQDDYTVLTVMKGRNVVEVKRWRHNSWNNIITGILTVLRKHGVRKCSVETNGVGDVFYDDIRDAAQKNNMEVTFSPFTTTNTSKNRIVERLNEDFNTENISIPEDPDLLAELDNFEANYSTKNRSIVYGARAGKHDDMVMSLAICNSVSRTSEKQGKYYFG